MSGALFFSTTCRRYRSGQRNTRRNRYFRGTFTGSLFSDPLLSGDTVEVVQGQQHFFQEDLFFQK